MPGCCDQREPARSLVGPDDRFTGLNISTRLGKAFPQARALSGHLLTDRLWCSCRGWGRWTRSLAGVTSAQIAEQNRQTPRDMRTCCESAGSGLDRTVKMTVVLADSRVYDEMNRVVAGILPFDPPARTTCTLQPGNGATGRNRVHRAYRIEPS